MSAYRALHADAVVSLLPLRTVTVTLPPPSPRSAADDLPFGERDFSGAFAWLDTHADERGAFEKARKVLGVSVNTLKARYASRDAGATKKGPAPRLGAEVESVIVDWIKLAHETGCSVPVETLCNKAREIARKLGVDPKSVGGDMWRKLFFRRHPELSVRQSQLIGLERLLSLNPEAVQRYFDILAIASAGVAPGDKYIMDETNVELRDAGGKVRDEGGEEGVHSASFSAHALTAPPPLPPPPPVQVVAPKGARKVYVTSTDAMHDHLSLLACGSSGGKWITPTLIWQGVRPLTKLFEGFPEALTAMTESGYNDGPTFASWAVNFVKESGASPTRPVLLCLDQHSSHLWLPALEYLREANVRVVALPPHTTDWLCALDTSSFVVFKRELYRLVNLARAAGRSVTKSSLSGYVRDAYKVMAKVDVDPLTGTKSGCLISGLRATGVEPFNPKCLPPQAFAPSAAIRRAASASKTPEEEAAAAAKPAALPLTAAERTAIAKSLCVVIPVGLSGALKARKGRPKQMAELLTGDDYLQRRVDAEEAKEQEVADTAARVAERKAKAAAKKAVMEERRVARVAALAAKAAPAPAPAAPPKVVAAAAAASRKRARSPAPPPRPPPPPQGYGSRPLPARYR